MEEIIKTLYPMNRCLLGEGFDNALEYINHLIGVEKIEVLSGKRLGTWTVPDEWIVRDAWVKFKGKKIIDYKKNPLSLIVGSLPMKRCFVDAMELRQHLHVSEALPESTPYTFKFYDKDWGFCVPQSILQKENTEGKPLDGVEMNGQPYIPKFENALEEGMYEVFIDTEYRPGVMKIGVHTIPGKSDREILLFAHLDHPYQANDNLSAVACLIDLAGKIKCEHTVKIIFCAETIGSIAYANTQDISKVDFVIALDICGNDNTLLLQKSWNMEARINRVAHVAIQSMGETHRKGMFRNVIGSDEYFFNDPQIGIPGIMLSRFPYKEYHTSEDTPDKIDYKKIEQTGNTILKIIDIWERDFIPKREFTGPLMRSRYGIQANGKQENLSWDYFIYAMDGKRSLAELCCECSIEFDKAYDVVTKMIHDQSISRVDISESRK